EPARGRQRDDADGRRLPREAGAVTSGRAVSSCKRGQRMTHEDNDNIWGLIAGSGVFILEICVLVPGLLACLLLAAALTLPLLLPAIPFALLAGLLSAVRWIARAGTRAIRGLAS